MRHYADTPSQQARQFAANAALDAAADAARRDASLARIRAAHQARQNRRAARRLGVTLTNHAEIAAFLNLDIK